MVRVKVQGELQGGWWVGKIAMLAGQQAGRQACRQAGRAWAWQATANAAHLAGLTRMRHAISFTLTPTHCIDPCPHLVPPSVPHLVHYINPPCPPICPPTCLAPQPTLSPEYMSSSTRGYTLKGGLKLRLER
jgi:hypothetical protein